MNQHGARADATAPGLTMSCAKNSSMKAVLAPAVVALKIWAQAAQK